MPTQDPKHKEIRAANVCIERTDERGVALTIVAGKLRLRLYIDAQWSRLVQKISAGRGELDRTIPFEMTPFSTLTPEQRTHLAEAGLSPEALDVGIVSTRTIEAKEIPGLTDDDALQDTPLWNALYPPVDDAD